MRPAGWTACAAFVRNDKAYLLDLIARRYPGTRPSDLYGRKSPDNPGGLDDYQAFQFDTAVAYRYSSLEEEDKQAIQSFYSNELRAIMRTMGNRQAKPERYIKKLGKTTDEDQQRRIERFFGMGGDAGAA
jgi:hypothetical protein